MPPVKVYRPSVGQCLNAFPLILHVSRVAMEAVQESNKIRRLRHSAL